jgi:hypothetical protein
MNRTTQFPFRIALIVVLASTILLMATPMVWAGPGSQTVPIATAIGPGSVILDLMRWSVHAAGKNCTNGCALALADLGTLASPPPNVTFESAVLFSGTPKGFLPATVRVCYQTTDKRDRIYYFDDDVQPNRWVLLRVTTRSSSRVCTNVRFGNVVFAAGR